MIGKGKKEGGGGKEKYGNDCKRCQIPGNDLEVREGKEFGNA